MPTGRGDRITAGEQAFEGKCRRRRFRVPWTCCTSGKEKFRRRMDIDAAALLRVDNLELAIVCFPNFSANTSGLRVFRRSQTDLVCSLFTLFKREMLSEIVSLSNLSVYCFLSKTWNHFVIFLCWCAYTIFFPSPCTVYFTAWFLVFKKGKFFISRYFSSWKWRKESNDAEI